MDREACQICGSDEVFRTRLWWRGCLECGSSHFVCAHCLHEWDLRLETMDYDPRNRGRLRHVNCPDAARVAKELMEPPRKTAEQASRSGTARRAWAKRKAKA